MVQIGTGNHLNSYLIGTVGPFPGVKEQGREAGQLCYTSKIPKNWRMYVSTPLNNHGNIISN